MNPRIQKKRKIFIITERFYPEDFRINDLALEWSKQGHSVKVLTQTPSYPFGKLYPEYKNRFFQKELWNGITIYRVYSVMGYRESLLRKLSNYFVHVLLGSFFALVVGKKRDVIFCYHTGPLTNVIPAVILKKFYRNHLILWTTDLWPDAVYAYGFKKSWWLRTLLKFIIQFVYNNCSCILVSSEGFIPRIKSYLKQRIDIHFVPHWPDRSLDLKKDSLSPEKKFQEEKIQFTFAGNIGKVQNLENVILGFSRARYIESMQLHIVGDGSNLETLKELVKKNNIQNVVFWGRKKPEEMGEVYRKSDILIISLVNDPLLCMTLPSKFQTYLSVGKPIFAIMNGDVRDKVIQYNLGLTAPPDDVEEIAKTFDRFASIDIGQYIIYSRNAQKAGEEWFDKDILIQKISSFLDKA